MALFLERGGPSAGGGPGPGGVAGFSRSGFVEELNALSERGFSEIGRRSGACNLGRVFRVAWGWEGGRIADHGNIE